MLSLLGDQKIFVLDEPTAGMDLQSRAETWEILHKFKKDKFIIVTTHYMDEAEAIGDRVAFMAKGQIKTCGSITWLKKRWALGYLVYVDKYPR